MGYEIQPSAERGKKTELYDPPQYEPNKELMTRLWEALKNGDYTGAVALMLDIELYRLSFDSAVMSELQKFYQVLENGADLLIQRANNQTKDGTLDIDIDQKDFLTIAKGLAGNDIPPEQSEALEKILSTPPQSLNQEEANRVAKFVTDWKQKVIPESFTSEALGAQFKTNREKLDKWGSRSQAAFDAITPRR